ncbi:MAG: type II secretion system protein GspN [Polyangiaceae bacterium]
MKPLWKRLLPYVAYPAFFCFCLLLFTAWTFPHEALRERIIVTFNAEQRKASSPQELHIESIGSSWITGIKLKNVKLVTASAPPKDPTAPADPPTELLLDEARVRVSLLPLLIGRKTVSFVLDAFGGKIDGSFSESGKDRSVELSFDTVDTSKIGPLTGALGLPVEGMLNGKIDLTMPEGKSSKGSGHVGLEITDMAAGDGKAKIKGTLALPRITLGNLAFEADAKEGILKVTKFGTSGKDVDLSGEGKIQMRELAMESLLDIFLKFKVNDNYRGKNDITKSLFGAPGSSAPALFDMDPKVKSAKRADGYYSFHARGTLGRPDFEPAPNAGGSMPGGSK